MKEKLILVAVVLGVAYGAVVWAVVADMVTGLSRSRREGRAVTSRGLRQTLQKLGEYLRVMTCLTVLDVVLMSAVVCVGMTGGPSWPVVPVATIAAAVGVVAIEVKSITENTPEGGRWHRVVSAVRGIIKLKKEIGV